MEWLPKINQYTIIEYFKKLGTEAEEVNQKIIEFRHWMHQNAEGHNKEFNTQAKIKEMLKTIGGFQDEEIKAIATTGLIIDIIGQAPESQNPMSIAFRADIDGLEMPETNPEISYSSKTSYAHMCGHDGHTATMIFAGCVLNKLKSKLPKNSKIRLMFQPAEEGPGGAEPMIKEGAMEGIDEVYGLHNAPNVRAGEIRVRPGPVMASISGVKIRVTGKGGHSSVPHFFNDVISAGANISTNLHQIKSRFIDSRENFVLTITQFHGGNANNVMPDECWLDGTVRCYSNDVFNIAKEKIVFIANSSAELFGCKASVEFYDYYPATINHEKETLDFIQFTKNLLGPDYVSQEGLPIPASEDFSYFLEQRPGFFFFLGTGRLDRFLHTSNYDYNDDMLAWGAYIWVKLVEYKLNVVLA